MSSSLDARIRITRPSGPVENVRLRDLLLAGRARVVDGALTVVNLPPDTTVEWFVPASDHTMTLLKVLAVLEEPHDGDYDEMSDYYLGVYGHDLADAIRFFLDLAGVRVAPRPQALQDYLGERCPQALKDYLGER